MAELVNTLIFALGVLMLGGFLLSVFLGYLKKVYNGITLPFRIAWILLKPVIRLIKKIPLRRKKDQERGFYET